MVEVEMGVVLVTTMAGNEFMRAMEMAKGRQGGRGRRRTVADVLEHEKR